MGWVKLVFTVASLAMLVSCKDKAPESGGYQERGKPESADVIAERPYLPTNPNGGVIQSKGVPIDPAENAERINRNATQPIIWGQSMAGVSMDMSLEQAEDTLARSLGQNNGFTFYPENIAIFWDTRTNPQSPFFMIAFDTYLGDLQLPEPFGSVKMGEDISRFFVLDPSGNAFLRDLGRILAGQPQGYDCREALTCSMIDDGRTIEFAYKRGSITVDQDLKVASATIIRNQDFFPRLAGSFIYGTSASGVSLGQFRSAIEANIGGAQRSSGGALFYDDMNFYVAYDLDMSSALIGVRGDYRGTIEFPAPIGNRNMGDSFNDLAALDDNGSELIVVLDRALHARAVDYDCLGEKTCRLTPNGDQIILELQQGAFVFSNDADKTLQEAMIYPELATFPDENSN